MRSSTGKLVLGRAQENGAGTGHFTGMIDEVRTDLGAVSEAEMATRAGWPMPTPDQLGKFVNAAGEWYTDNTSAKPRDGYRFNTVLGRPAPAGAGTVMLRSCKSGTDHFTATACGTATQLGDIGPVYTAQPASPPTVALYSCTRTGDRFDSLDPNCEGATKLGLHGYTVAYAMLSRYFLSPQDHFTTIHGTVPSYVYEQSHGYIGLTQTSGTVWLYSCAADIDQFVSLDPACEGKTLIGRLGTVWSQAPAGTPSTAVYRCLVNAQRFTSTKADCGGYTVDRLLGHVLTELPA
jgi:hypothetical protein